MQIEDIHKQKWKVSDNFKEISLRTDSISLFEQECHINILRCGYKDESKPEVRVDCTNQIYITKLSQSAFFTLQEAIVSSVEKNNPSSGKVLGVKGILPANAITIRKKKRIFTKEEIKDRSERMKAFMKKRKI